MRIQTREETIVSARQTLNQIRSVAEGAELELTLAGATLEGESGGLLTVSLEMCAHLLCDMLAGIHMALALLNDSDKE